MEQGGKGLKKIRRLPIGIENFEKIRTEDFYYVDKTGMIADLLNNWGLVNLFTRPRRFGKSLNMSMLEKFFGYGCDERLFEGLEIAKEEELCRKYMGKFPVIAISLKDVNGVDYETAQELLRSVIGNTAMKFQYLLESDKLSPIEITRYSQIINMGTGDRKGFAMSWDVLVDSLFTLTGLLQKHHGKDVIVIIDEYDVPLDKAQQAGYYDEMLGLIRGMFSRVLKGNDSLYFAVMSGCLKMAKESIFTGLNNFKAFAATDVRFHERFGFTDEEVKAMLAYYGLSHKFDAVKEWYDGYRFGKTDVYCPWDVISYVDLLCADSEASPKAFWINTSGNEIIRRFIGMAKMSTRREIEQLINGEIIIKKINQELTYRELYGRMDNLWSVLFMTGYLTSRGETGGELYQLAIPNLEIKKIFIEQIQAWFEEEVSRDAPKLDAFCDAYLRADKDAVEAQFNEYLRKTISIRDTNTRNGRKENFYHGILLGLLSHREDWDVISNAESGDGYSDILVEAEEEGIGIVIEVKYAEEGLWDAGCRQALEQIERMGYETRLYQDGMDTVIKYGIACNKKRCKVRLGS